MCKTESSFTHVRIMRCPHGTNYLAMDHLTLLLTDAELALLDQAIHKLARRAPVLRQALYRALCGNHLADEEGAT